MESYDITGLTIQGKRLVKSGIPIHERSYSALQSFTSQRSKKHSTPFTLRHKVDKSWVLLPAPISFKPNRGNKAHITAWRKN